MSSGPRADQSLDPNPIRLDAAIARSSAAEEAYLRTICDDRHPAIRMRSDSFPPDESQSWANECLSW